jgi:hypothetical protein
LARIEKYRELASIHLAKRLDRALEAAKTLMANEKTRTTTKQGKAKSKADPLYSSLKSLFMQVRGQTSTTISACRNLDEAIGSLIK